MSYVVVADRGNFRQRLQSIVLNLFIVDWEACKDAIHNIITLVFIHKVLGSGGHDSLKGLNGMSADLRLLTINVLYCAIKDSLDFILLEGLRIVFLELG